MELSKTGDCHPSSWHVPELPQRGGKCDGRAGQRRKIAERPRYRSRYIDDEAEDFFSELKKMNLAFFKGKFFFFFFVLFFVLLFAGNGAKGAVRATHERPRLALRNIGALLGSRPNKLNGVLMQLLTPVVISTEENWCVRSASPLFFLDHQGGVCLHGAAQ